MVVYKSEFLKSRLFLPLTSEAFEWFHMGKTVEVRIKKGRFKNIHKFNYKYAELRKGYNGKSVYAAIIKIEEYSGIKQLLNKLDHHSIVPLQLPTRGIVEKLESYTNSSSNLLAIHLSFVSVVEG